MNEMPDPHEAVKRLHAFAGAWSGKETMYPSPWGAGGPAKAKIVARVACDGLCVVQDYTQVAGGKVTYRGHGVFGYDAKEERYLMHWTDCMTGVPPQAVPGNWDGDVLKFAHVGPMGHFRYLYRFRGKKRLDMLLENSQDGEHWVPFIEASYKRKKVSRRKAAKVAAKRAAKDKNKQKDKDKDKKAKKDKKNK